MIILKNKYEVVTCSICGKKTIYKKIFPAILYRQGLTATDLKQATKKEDLEKIAIGTIFICQECKEKLLIYK